MGIARTGFMGRHGPATALAAILYADFTSSESVPSSLSYSGASQKTRFNSAGALEYAPNNVIINSVLAGAAAGTPGTDPTGLGATASVSGLTRQLSAVGTLSDGTPYVSYRWSGTASSSGNANHLIASTIPAATVGQRWGYSAVVGLTVNSGSTPLVRLEIDERNGGSFLAGTQTTIVPTTTPTRFSTSRTFNQSTVTGTLGYVQVAFTNGTAYDFTIVVAAPMMELVTASQTVPGPYNATTANAYYGPAYQYNPSTLAALGFDYREQRTNSIRNNTMQGAVAGSPGTAPTNWAVLGAAATYDGLTITTSLGAESGMPYIDVRLAGTISAGGVTSTIEFGTSTEAVAAQNEIWVLSSFLKYSGTAPSSVFSAVSHSVLAIGADGSTTVANHIGSDFRTSLTTSFTRREQVTTLTAATTTYVRPRLRFTTGTAGTVVDTTIRIAIPQMEKVTSTSSKASPPILTFGSALTRAADVWTFNAGTALEQLKGDFSAIVEGIPGQGSGDKRAIDIGPTSNDFLVAVPGSNVAGLVRNGGTATLSANTYTPGATIRIGATMRSDNTASACLDGGTVVTGTAVSRVAKTNAYLGSSQGTADFWNGTISKLAIYAPLSDAQLKAKTTAGASL